MTFDRALNKLKHGCIITQRSNDTPSYIFLADGVIKQRFRGDYNQQNQTYHWYLVNWTASSHNLLADDWEVVTDIGNSENDD